MKTISIALFFCVFLTPAFAQAWFDLSKEKPKNSITLRLKGQDYHSKPFHTCTATPFDQTGRCFNEHCITYQRQTIPVHQMLMRQTKLFLRRQQELEEFKNKKKINSNLSMEEKWKSLKNKKEKRNLLKNHITYQNALKTLNFLYCEREFNDNAIKKFKQPLRKEIKQ